MAILDNPRHELFAQGLAKGKPQRDAYLDAGFQPSSDEVADACASRLAKDDDISERVKEMQDKAARKIELDRYDIIRMIMDDRILARENKQAAAAIRASELLGKELAGMFVEKKEIKTGLLEDVDAGQLERLRETLTAERIRRAAERSGSDGDRKEDRVILPGPRPAEAGALSKAS